MKLAGLWQEFKAFAFKGNFIDLAVAVVLGGAIGGVVNSLAKDVLMQLASYLTPGIEGYQDWKLGRVEIGAFLGNLSNFLIIALAMFLVVVKLMGTIQRSILPAGPDEPTTKECPLCLSTIPIKARKCAQCTADLPADG